MKKKKSFFSNKGWGYFLLLPAIVCAVLAYFAYNTNGVTVFSPELNQNAIVCLYISIAFCIVSLILNWKLTTYAAYLVCLFGFTWFLYSQITYIANVFVSIDGTSFSDGFLLTAACYLLACIFMLFAGIFSKRRVRA